jgi:hypothetical protein
MVLQTVISYTGPTDFYARMHAEQFTFNGDPALKMNTFSLPDFVIDSTQILSDPVILLLHQILLP